MSVTICRRTGDIIIRTSVAWQSLPSAGWRLRGSFRSAFQRSGSKELIAGHFEYPTEVWGGGRAMTDMMAFMPDGVIAVEAKVDEPFDDPIAVWIFREEEKKPDSPPRRTGIVQQYARALRVRSEKLLNIRYQLLQRTLCAAKAAKERRVSRAWMVVQAFPGGDQEKRQVNRADFERYLDLVGSAPELDGIRVQLAWVSEIGPG
jgi:hypothetical protein